MLLIYNTNYYIEENKVLCTYRPNEWELIIDTPSIPLEIIE